MTDVQRRRRSRLPWLPLLRINACGTAATAKMSSESHTMSAPGTSKCPTSAAAANRAPTHKIARRSAEKLALAGTIPVLIIGDPGG